MKEIVYPDFIKCCNFTNDIFWKNIFLDLSYGISPYNTYIYKDSLMSNIKNKEFNYRFDFEKDNETIYNEIYNILHYKFGILSSEEINEQKILFQSQNKKKSIKNILIEHFCIKKGDQYNLTFVQIQKLLNTIFLLISLKIIKEEDFIYLEKDNKTIIENIECINFEKNKFNINIDILLKTNNIEILSDTDSIIDCWDKYLKYLIK
jgi:hypothetical protein